jgi:hypothetical protein
MPDEKPKAKPDCVFDLFCTLLFWEPTSAACSDRTFQDDAMSTAIDIHKYAVMNSLPRAVATFDFQAESEKEISFHAGDQIRVLGTPDGDWWQGEVAGMLGWFPKSYVRLQGPLSSHSGPSSGEHVRKMLCVLVFFVSLTTSDTRLR